MTLFSSADLETMLDEAFVSGKQAARADLARGAKVQADFELELRALLCAWLSS